MFFIFYNIVDNEMASYSINETCNNNKLFMNSFLI